ncbi:MAG: hypothetical protein ACREJX_15085, partial [Polyangiaceae bacterium]
MILEPRPSVGGVRALGCTAAGGKCASDFGGAIAWHLLRGERDEAFSARSMRDDVHAGRVRRANYYG